MSFYVLDEHNNLIESMSKEEIIAAIQTAAAGGNFEGFKNAAFVSKLRELNKNAEFGVWVGTQAEYNSIFTKAKNVLYLISDDPLCNDLPNKVALVVKAIDEIELKLEGYDKTEQELKTGFETVTTDFAAVNESFAEVNENFAAVQAEFETVKGFANTTEVIYKLVEGESTSSIKTTRPITDFREICVVYCSSKDGINKQARFFVNDINGTIELSVVELIKSTEYASVHDIYIGIARFDISETMGVTKFTEHEDMSFTHGSVDTWSSATLTIKKIYGIGEVV